MAREERFCAECGERVREGAEDDTWVHDTEDPDEGYSLDADHPVRLADETAQD